ncbi:MAG TPA: NACHT domain-containing protein [Ktedonobacteraceae bacterium]|nr:NACHT domain-containing protein [Ktedonobacteraceae bacterium]
MEPGKLVYFFAPADAALRDQLSAHLQPLVQEGLITEWHDLLIAAGSDVAEERRRAWSEADIFLLLISADYFLPATYDEQVMRAAIERQKRGQLLIVPILLRPCAWQATMPGTLQALPRNGTFVTSWEERDAAFFTIARELRLLLTDRQVPRGNGPVRPSLQAANRQRLLKQVRNTWIDGLLEKSLHRAVWVDLHLQEQADALENPWRLVVQELEHEPRPLPPGTSIIQVFDQADEELLILGEPGAGKTTLLLYLTRTLLERAEADERRRVPVIFPLSSWAQRSLPLDQWLVEELKTKYQIPAKIGRAWVDTDQIFPLLDGLDEVAESAREACAQAIIAYTRRSQERASLVICCRNEEYQALALQLPLQYAVLLLPFTNEQIEFYLSSVSGQLDVLRQALYEDQELFELARRPLLLSVFTLAYHDADAIDLPAAARQNYPQALFRYYVKHMLERRAHLRQVTEEQVYHWLTYLATQLQEQQQTIFALEHLQPAWLPERFRGWYRWGMTLVYGLTFGLIFGPVFGVAFACAYELIARSGGRLVFGLIFGLLIGLCGGVIGGLVFGATFKQHQTIQAAEASAWSWGEARKGGIVGAVGGLLFTLMGGLVGGFIEGWPGAIVVGLSVEFIALLVSSVVGGLSPVQLSDQVALTPNEGIWRSGKRGLLVVLFFILIFGLGAGLAVGLIGQSIGSFAYGPLLGIVLGAGGGLVFGLAFSFVGGRTGLAAFLQHFVLRLFLWRLNLLPWKLVAFMDEATERLLLRKMGGKYIFVHRLLRDALATPEQDSQ